MAVITTSYEPESLKGLRKAKSCLREASELIITTVDNCKEASSVDDMFRLLERASCTLDSIKKMNDMVYFLEAETKRQEGVGE